MEIFFCANFPDSYASPGLVRGADCRGKWNSYADQLLRAAGPRALAGRGRRELAQRVPPLLDLRRIRGRLLPARRRLGIGAQQARTRREVLRLPRYGLD